MPTGIWKIGVLWAGVINIPTASTLLVSSTITSNVFSSVCTRWSSREIVKWLFKCYFSKKRHVWFVLFRTLQKCHMKVIIILSFNPICKNCSWMCEVKESLIFWLKRTILLEFHFKRILSQLLHWIPLTTHNYHFWYFIANIFISDFSLF